MKAVIIAGGKKPSKELLLNEIKNSDILICADSGANCLYEYEVFPHILLGDFDSINKDAFEFFKLSKCKIEKFPKEKDYTDTELAMYKAFDLGVDEITFLGCTGSRIDHLLSNFGLLLKCLKEEVKAVIKDENNEVLIADKPITIKGSSGKLFSLQAYGDFVEGLTIEGAKYPLENYKLNIGEPIGTSNEFLQDEVKITFSSGILLIIFSKD